MGATDANSDNEKDGYNWFHEGVDLCAPPRVRIAGRLNENKPPVENNLRWDKRLFQIALGGCDLRHSINEPVEVFGGGVHIGAYTNGADIFPDDPGGVNLVFAEKLGYNITWRESVDAEGTDGAGVFRFERDV